VKKKEYAVKINKILILAGSILFIAAVIIWGISCARKPVSQPAEKTPVFSQVSTPEKEETVKTPVAVVQLPSTSTVTSVSTPETLPGKPVIQETIKIEKIPIATDTTGPVADSATQAKSQPLPVFRPVHNYIGPASVVENTVTTQQSTAIDSQITGFNPENTLAQEQQVTTNPAGGQKLPSFTPVTNKTGPVKVK